MLATLQLPLNEEKLREFCRKWMISELAVFGSILRDDFGPESDVDFLVSFAPESHASLLDLVHMHEELAGIVGRPVDIATRKGIENSRNYIRRRAILESAQPLYVG
jgi:predicted nucleotidyltransferase